MQISDRALDFFFSGPLNHRKQKNYYIRKMLNGENKPAWLQIHEISSFCQ